LLRFSLRDTGIGMSREQQALLFQPFSQVDTSTTRKFGGTGLGLAISKNIVEMMGGRIWVESEPGLGSCFHFTARLLKTSVDESSTPPAAEPGGVGDAASRLHGARVLLVEDNEINQEVVKEILSAIGVRVTIADNGRQALDLLDLEDFDGVLMDCQMPVMDGYEATRRILAQPRFSDLPILAMTANALPGDREQVLQAGMVDHIAKPFQPDVMFATMAKWIIPDQKR